MKSPITISASEFKAKCLKILDRLEPEGIIITKHGQPVARVQPVGQTDNRMLIGSMKGRIRIKGSLLSTGAEWNAQPGHPHRRRSTRR